VCICVYICVYVYSWARPLLPTLELLWHDITVTSGGSYALSQTLSQIYSILLFLCYSCASEAFTSGSQLTHLPSSISQLYLRSLSKHEQSILPRHRLHSTQHACTPTSFPNFAIRSLATFPFSSKKCLAPLCLQFTKLFVSGSSLTEF